ncbi:hypothetical protein [Chryseobacterium herbae]|uniref:Uncharacterized protein n=1 Tax=Chryseobacterium herbae TaxID=2976476 RepID=A0ABT2ISP4_9FLAO|nr:hypothetical protein [Chryseobacterium sp. pc1-10]MCT2561847.1 hypothetical protein [Chryseobacterium sp. pc1-10]
MKIIDLNGRSIEVTDLNKAIRIAKQCKSYQHEDKRFADLDRRLHAYWTDFHGKLLKLKSKLAS